MDIENDFIKPVVLFYYNEGLSEQEARKEITKKYGQYGITMRTINKWYNILKSEEDMSDKKPTGSKHKISDEFLIDLINDNPDLTMAELGELAGTSATVISTRLRGINSDSERVKYKYKTTGKPKKFSDEFLINLANENPGVTITKLSSLAGASFSAVSRRIKKINSSEQRIQCMSKAGKRSELTDEFLINLVNENPELTMQKLGELVGVTTSTISYRLSKIKSKGGNLKYSYKNSTNYTFKEGQISNRVTNQRIIELVNQNPELNMKELAKLAGTSLSTIWRRIRIIKNSCQMLDYNPKKFQNGKSKSIKIPKNFAERFQIGLDNENPGFNTVGLAKPVDTDIKTLSSHETKISYKDTNVDCCSKKNTQLIPDEIIIDLVNSNPNLNLEKLSKLIGTSARTLSRRIKQINSNGKVINYVKKKTVSKTALKFTEEFLINLVNENPELNMKELANIANVSVGTISNRINEINCKSVRANYIKKYQKLDD
jgi:DNA-binding Lrp family transcriptional regulator